MMIKQKRYLMYVLLVALLVGTTAVVSAGSYDLGGQTIGISMFNNFWGVTPLGERGVYNWYDPDPRLKAHIEEVEQLFNVKIEFMPRTGEGRVVEAIAEQILAGESNIHFFQETYHSLPSLVAQGMIHPLDDYLTAEYFERLPVSFRRAYKISGAYYGFEALNFVTEPLGIVWNKDIFEQYDMPDLYEIYEAGEWTWDALEEIATQLTLDTTGDGTIDQIGFLLHLAPTSNTVANFATTNQGTLTKSIDGLQVVSFTEPETVDTLDFLQKMFANGTATSQNLFGTPYIWAMCAITPHHIQMQGMTDRGTNMGYLPLPKGPNMEEHVAPRTNAWTGVIPIYVEDPAAVIEIVNALWQLSAPYISDLDTWEDNYWAVHALHLADRESLVNWQWAKRNAFHIDNRRTVLDTGFNGAVNSILFDQMPIDSTLAQIAPAVQAALDELYGQ